MENREGDLTHVIATYREVAAHFGLKGPDQGRTKVKRAGWLTEPQNHPADPIRVRVPREAWDGASQARERTGVSFRREKASQAERSPPSQNATDPLSFPPELPALIKQLEGAHATLRERLERADAEAKAAHDLAEQRATELAAVRELLARREGELDGLKLGTEHLHDRLTQAERVREEAQRQALEGKAAADAERRAREAAEAALAQLRGRGLWRRIRNRP
jgi:hypothetical protein